MYTEHIQHTRFFLQIFTRPIAIVMTVTQEYSYTINATLPFIPIWSQHFMKCVFFMTVNDKDDPDDNPPQQVERWLRLRRLQQLPNTLQKFQETGWRWKQSRTTRSYLVVALTRQEGGWTAFSNEIVWTSPLKLAAAFAEAGGTSLKVWRQQSTHIHFRLQSLSSSMSWH